MEQKKSLIVLKPFGEGRREPTCLSELQTFLLYMLGHAYVETS